MIHPEADMQDYGFDKFFGTIDSFRVLALGCFDTSLKPPYDHSSTQGIDGNYGNDGDLAFA